MTGTTRTSHGLDPRRRRALFRAWRRGTREMDLLLGRFADSRIATLSEADLADFEALLAVPDDDLFAWLSGRSPAGTATPVFRAVHAFSAEQAGADK